MTNLHPQSKSVRWEILKFIVCFLTKTVKIFQHFKMVNPSINFLVENQYL